MIIPVISSAAKNATKADIMAITKILASRVASAIIEVITVPSAPITRSIFPHVLPF